MKRDHSQEMERVKAFLTVIHKIKEAVDFLFEATNPDPNLHDSAVTSLYRHNGVVVARELYDQAQRLQKAALSAAFHVASKEQDEEDHQK